MKWTVWSFVTNEVAKFGNPGISILGTNRNPGILATNKRYIGIMNHL